MPSWQGAVRTRAGENFRAAVRLLRVDEGGKASGYYWIAPALADTLAALPAVARKIRDYEIFCGIDRNGHAFLWPIRLPGPYGQINPWHESAMHVALQAQTRWVRILVDRNLGCYEVVPTPGEDSVPMWPDKSLEELVRLGFQHRLIDTLDHPVIKKIRALE